MQSRVEKLREMILEASELTAFVLDHSGWITFNVREDEMLS